MYLFFWGLSVSLMFSVFSAIHVSLLCSVFQIQFVFKDFKETVTEYSGLLFGVMLILYSEYMKCCQFDY